MPSDHSESGGAKLTAEGNDPQAIEDPLHGAFILNHSNEGRPATWTVWILHELSKEPAAVP